MFGLGLAVIGGLLAVAVVAGYGARNGRLFPSLPLPYCCTGNEPIPLTRAHLLGCVLIGWAVLSVLWAPQPLYSLNGLWQVVILPAICFCLGSQNRSLRPLFIGAGIGLAVSSAISIGQLAGWIDWPSINTPSGLFLNKNFMAEAAALVLIWLIAERVWWLVVLVAPCVVLAGARGALLALAIGLGLLTARRLSRLTLGLLAAVAGLFIIGLWGPDPVDWPFATLGERWSIWVDTVHGIGLLGSGIGSYGFMPHPMQPDGTLMHAHNDYLELVYELGAIGAILGALFAWELRGPLNSGPVGSDRIRSGGVLCIPVTSTSHAGYRCAGCRPCCSGSGCGTAGRYSPPKFWQSRARGNRTITRR